jgi:hypothetical protein
VTQTLYLKALFLLPKPVGLLTRYIKNDAFIHISTFPFSGDVGCHTNNFY